MILSFKDRATGKRGFKNTETGEIIIPPMYDSTSLGFDDYGFAQVGINHKYGCIDRTNKIVISMQYDSIWYSTNGFYAVELNGEEFCIDRQENRVENVKPCFFAIHTLDETDRRLIQPYCNKCDGSPFFRGEGADEYAMCDIVYHLIYYPNKTDTAANDYSVCSKRCPKCGGSNFFLNETAFYCNDCNKPLQQCPRCGNELVRCEADVLCENCRWSYSG